MLRTVPYRRYRSTEACHLQRSFSWIRKDELLRVDNEVSASECVASDDEAYLGIAPPHVGHLPSKLRVPVAQPDEVQPLHNGLENSNTTAEPAHQKPLHRIIRQYSSLALPSHADLQWKDAV